MERIYRKIKRPVCIVLAAIIIITAPIVSYKEVKAAEIAVPLIEQLLSMFCVSAGLGNQPDFAERAEFFTNLCNAASAGETITLEDYGDIDFSDAQSIDNALKFGIDMNKFLLGGLNVIDAKHAATYTQIGKQLDRISYGQSGTSASASLSDFIQVYSDLYSDDSSSLVDDVKECFSVITGDGIFNDLDTDDDAAKAERRRKFWLTFSALTSVGLIGAGSAALPLSLLKECEETEYQDYSFLDVCFDGTYQTNADGNYVYKMSCDKQLWNYNCTAKYDFYFDCSYKNKIVGWFSSDLSMIHFLDCNGGCSLPASNGQSLSFIFNSGYTGNIPLYPSQDAALAALKADDFSDAENIDNSYSNFKSATDSSNSVVGDAFTDSFSNLKDLNDISNLAPKVLDAADSSAGTADALLAVLNALTGEAADTDTDAGTSSGSATTNYSGILGKILTALNTIIAGINGIPLKMVNQFANKFITAKDLIDLVNGIPDAVAVAFEFPVVKPIVDAVTGIPAAIVEPLTDIFPNSIAVGEAILGFPAAVADAVKGIDITVPDITIPDIAIPDIVIPDIVIPDIAIPDIAIPDVNVTVNNDYASLLDIIYQAVSAVLTALFIPDEALAKEKLGAIAAYFEFKDDIVDAVDLFINNLKGITPSPYLKIPIGHSTGKYNYGTGDYFIIDASWYAQYKSFGDKIILAIAWAFFLWRVFIKLPGIINGTEGSIIAANKSYERYSKQD